MPRTNPAQVSARGMAVDQPPGTPRSDDLLAITNELGPVVSVTRWRQADCCDSIVANGAIGWVLHGIVRKSLILENGQRRIVDFLMPGAFFGLRTDDAELFCFEASADETRTARISRRDFNGLAAVRPPFCQFFLEGACQTIARLENHILIQGRTTSIEKIASYLLSMSRRLSTKHDTAVTLPMSRYDIADHVGIAVETVSRAITELRRQGVIELETPRCLSMRDVQNLNDSVLDRR